MNKKSVGNAMPVKNGFPAKIGLTYKTYPKLARSGRSNPVAVRNCDAKILRLEEEWKTNIAAANNKIVMLVCAAGLPGTASLTGL